MADAGWTDGRGDEVAAPSGGKLPDGLSRSDVYIYRVCGTTSPHYIPLRLSLISFRPGSRIVSTDGKHLVIGLSFIGAKESGPFRLRTELVTTRCLTGVMSSLMDGMKSFIR